MIRQANNDDIAILTTMRIAQLDEEEPHPDTDIYDAIYHYYQQHLNQDLIQLVWIEDEKIVATAGLMEMPFAPGFFNPIGTRGYICSVYTDPSYRHQHYATKLIKACIEIAQKKGLTRLFLEASVHGIPVYEKLGFTFHETMMEMKLG